MNAPLTIPLQPKDFKSDYKPVWCPGCGDYSVLVASGDGDGYSIGGNHFLHACRRNVDLTYIVMDNHVYGMTKGQPSPTTEPDWCSKLAPGGTGVREFHPLVIALASGANFIARGFSGDPNGCAGLIAEAGALPEHVCRMTAYCCDKPAYLAARPELGRIWREVMGRHYPAMSMIFVSDLLDSPGKIELEATAVIPGEM